ncbi:MULTISPECIES: DUF294 nucleotidyltransferase-like domain-containing protein [Halomonadaceae]|uniref:DUF294 nucleotidyltransferase-like domain-containing protein n=1 Tax=Halomonadaceae TaxID=28256 RepID=UPI0015979F0B|nr:MULTISPECIES: DUF294 nucleotidyltransferase-like domain-containing protein [Halomonas]QJQ94255.1 signal transduction protein [Halomonas sp. PA5]
MRLLHRASPWRALFAQGIPPDHASWPPLLAPLRDAFMRLGPSQTLAQAKAWQPVLVEALLRLDVPASRISQLLSDHNSHLYRQAIELSLGDMRGEGWGPPPVNYCVLILGSGARHESLLGPDQDNAMIVEDYPDARHSEIDGYFQSLGERFTERLDKAGIPLCNGHVMARWPMWRKRLSEWYEQLEIWTAERRTKRVQQANTLFDFQVAHGDALLADALRAKVSDLVPCAHLFLDEMASLLDETPVALDRLGRVAGDGEGAPHESAIELKRQGLMPLVSGVRLLALARGCRGVDTRTRLMELVATGGLNASRAESLQGALDRLQAVLLEHQMASLAMGRQADGWVDMREMNEASQLLLRHDLKTIRRLVRLAQERAGS